MELPTNLSFIEAAIQQLLSPKLTFYSLQDLHKIVLQHPHLKCQSFQVACSLQKNNFKAFHISGKTPQQRKPCIIYLHGLSSFAFEGSYLIPHLETDYSLCLYDLRGHGRNTGERVTYGVEQSNDLYRLMETLCQKYKIGEFYLWGRSMGGSICLQLLNKLYKNNSFTLQQKIKGVVLDSVFSSFSKIVEEVISATIHLPAFISSMIVRSCFAKIERDYNINFNHLDYSNLQHVKCPAIFVYSQDDEIVGFHHSDIIAKNYGGYLTKLQDKFTHNESRSNSIIQKVLKKLNHNINKAVTEYSLDLESLKKNLGLSVSISHRNSVHKIRNSMEPHLTPQRPSERLTKFITPKLREKEIVCESSISSQIKNSINRKRHAKIKTSKKLIEEQNDHLKQPSLKRIEIPKPRSSIPAHYNVKQQENSYQQQINHHFRRSSTKPFNHSENMLYGSPFMNTANQAGSTSKVSQKVSQILSNKLYM